MTLSEFLTAALSLTAAPLNLLFGNGGEGHGPLHLAHQEQPSYGCDATDPYAVHACISEEVQRLDDHGHTRQAHYQPSVRGAGLQEWPRKLTSGSDGPKYNVDDIVELYWEGSAFAIPCLVTPYTTYDGYMRKYHLHNNIMDADHNGVPEVLIHPYLVYAAGTEAKCNIGSPATPGSPATIDFVPCTVVSSDVKESGIASTAYELTYPGYPKDGEGYFPQFLPLNRVQRLRVQADEEPVEFAGIFD